MIQEKQTLITRPFVVCKQNQFEGINQRPIDQVRFYKQKINENRLLFSDNHIQLFHQNRLNDESISFIDFQDDHSLKLDESIGEIICLVNEYEIDQESSKCNQENIQHYNSKKQQWFDKKNEKKPVSSQGLRGHKQLKVDSSQSRPQTTSLKQFNIAQRTMIKNSLNAKQYQSQNILNQFRIDGIAVGFQNNRQDWFLQQRPNIPIHQQSKQNRIFPFRRKQLFKKSMG